MSKEKKTTTKKKTTAKGKFAGKKIEFAPQNKVLAEKSLLEKLLIAVGHPEALVSDESRIRDFQPIDFSKKAWVENVEWNERVIKRCKTIFGIDIEPVFEKKIPEVLNYIKEKT